MKHVNCYTCTWTLSKEQRKTMITWVHSTCRNTCKTLKMVHVHVWMCIYKNYTYYCCWMTHSHTKTQQLKSFMSGSEFWLIQNGFLRVNYWMKLLTHSCNGSSVYTTKLYIHAHEYTVHLHLHTHCAVYLVIAITPEINRIKVSIHIFCWVSWRRRGTFYFNFRYFFERHGRCSLLVRGWSYWRGGMLYMGGGGGGGGVVGRTRSERGGGGGVSWLHLVSRFIL